MDLNISSAIGLALRYMAEGFAAAWVVIEATKIARFWWAAGR